MRFQFGLMLGLPVLEITEPLLDFLYAFRKGLHNLIEIGEQLVLIGHSCLELDDAFFHGDVWFGRWFRGQVPEPSLSTSVWISPSR